MLRHPSFNSRPTLGQFAMAGCWERAWAFEVAERPDPEALRGYLGGAGEIAFEAFFGEAFLGIRCAGGPAAAEAMALDCLEALDSAENGADWFRRLAGGLHPAGPEAFAEVGAVNAWNSPEPFRIANPGTALADFAGLWRTLGRSPLERDAAHRKALEFVRLEPVHSWIALPVSAPGPPFALDPDRLREALALAAGTRRPDPPQ